MVEIKTLSRLLRVLTGISKRKVVLVGDLGDE